MATLYDADWRQGSYLRHSLTMSDVLTNSSMGVVTRSTEHDLWMVVTQDCDLDGVDESDELPLIELRSVYDDGDTGRVRGLRSREFRPSPDATRYLQAQSARLMISPAALSACLWANPQARENVLTADDRAKLKTWLGKRYDRAAVPRELVPLGGAIAEAVKMNRKADVVPGIRDILWQAEAHTPQRYSLFAILENGATEDAARKWLVRVSLSIKQELGIVDEVEAATADRISLKLLETSYGADVSDITWSKGRPRGAY